VMEPLQCPFHLPLPTWPHATGATRLLMTELMAWSQSQADALGQGQMDPLIRHRIESSPALDDASSVIGGRWLQQNGPSSVECCYTEEVVDTCE
jgi:hypothetical protein